MEEEREQMGSVFVRMSKVLLEVYTIYCKNYNLATLALRKVCTHALPPTCIMHVRTHTCTHAHMYTSCLCYSLYCIVIIHGPPLQHLLVCYGSWLDIARAIVLYSLTSTSLFVYSPTLFSTTIFLLPHLFPISPLPQCPTVWGRPRYCYQAARVHGDSARQDCLVGPWLYAH